MRRAKPDFWITKADSVVTDIRELLRTGNVRAPWRLNDTAFIRKGQVRF